MKLLTLALIILRLFETNPSDSTDPLSTWITNAVSEVRIVGLGVVGIGILIVGMRFIFAGFIGSEHQNVIAKSGIIVLIAGAAMIIGSSGVLAILYHVVGVKQ